MVAGPRRPRADCVRSCWDRFPSFLAGDPCEDRRLPPSRPACNSLNSGNIVNTVGLVFDDEGRKKK